MRLRELLTLSLLILFFASCRSKQDSSEQNKGEDITVVRYDRLQSEYVKFNSVSALQKMNTTYARITQILVEEILSIGTVSDANINESIKNYYSDTTLLQLMDDVETKFADLKPIESKLSKGFKRLKKELPDLVVPSIYTQVSALNESVVVADSLLGISLDKYMGEDYSLYNRFYYDYQSRSMRPDRIVPDCFIYYLLGGYPLPSLTERTLLENMLRQGQIYYVVQQVLGYQTIGDVIGYSEAEKEWWLKNKKKVWEYILGNNMLSTTDPMIIRRFMYHLEPLTSFFGEGAPSLIGIYMGGEIISGFMKQNKKVSLNELLHMTDYHYLLNNSSF